MLAVLLFHQGFSWASGGYLGVSTFFTLSGFLITSLLLWEHRTTGRIALTQFWGRRIRRLLPALVVAFAGIAVFGRFAATTAQARSIGEDGPWAIFYLANWRFVVDGNSYADLFSSDETSPLLHLWSLAIEEQFYLVFPLVMVAVLAVLGARRRTVLLALGAAALGSVIATGLLIANGASESRIYYGTDTRAFELLIGAVLAVAIEARLQDGSLARSKAWIRRTGPAVGALMVTLWVVLSKSTSWLYDGGFVLYALLTVAVVYTAVHSGPLQRILEWRPLVRLGHISYGLYLVHWPIYLWLNPARTGLDGWLLFGLRAAVSIAAATLSYLLVEQPIRRQAWSTGEPKRRLSGVPAGARLVGAVAAAMALAVGVLQLVPQVSDESRIVLEPLSDRSSATPTPDEDAPDRSASGGGAAAFVLSQSGPVDAASEAITSTSDQAAVDELIRAGAQDPSAEVAGISEERSGAEAAGIDSSEGDTEPTVLLVGDSVMLTFGRGLERWGETTGSATFWNAAALGCGLGRGGELWQRGVEVENFAHCEAMPDTWREIIATEQPELVAILIGVWDLKPRRQAGWDDWLIPGMPEFDAWLVGEYEDAIAILGSGGADVVLFNAPCLQRNSVAGDPVLDDVFDPALVPAYNSGVIAMVAERTGVSIMDLDSQLCPDGEATERWPGVEGELRPDGVHFSESSSSALAQFWGPQLLTHIA